MTNKNVDFFTDYKKFYREATASSRLAPSSALSRLLGPTGTRPAPIPPGRFRDHLKRPFQTEISLFFDATNLHTRSVSLPARSEPQHPRPWRATATSTRTSSSRWRCRSRRRGTSATNARPPRASPSSTSSARPPPTPAAATPGQGVRPRGHASPAAAVTRTTTPRSSCSPSPLATRTTPPATAGHPRPAVAGAPGRGGRLRGMTETWTTTSPGVGSASTRKRYGARRDLDLRGLAVVALSKVVVIEHCDDQFVCVCVAGWNRP
jgi:hypothetical protein